MELTKAQELHHTILRKAWSDQNFKQELIANPVNAIEKLTGNKINLSKGKTMIVNDQTDDSVVFFNIPAEPSTENIELTEEQLETIAGGGDFPLFDLIPDPLKDYFFGNK